MKKRTSSTDKDIKRLKSKISVTSSGCWQWLGGIDRHGYGAFSFRGRKWLAHRASYQLLIGPIPEGYCLDHRCRNPGCCNPWHVDPVTRKANTLKGIAPSAINARKRQCVHGHAFSDINTYRYKGRRHCRQCNREAVRRYKARIGGGQ